MNTEPNPHDLLDCAVEADDMGRVLLRAGETNAAQRFFEESRECLALAARLERKA